MWHVDLWCKFFRVETDQADMARSACLPTAMGRAQVLVTPTDVIMTVRIATDQVSFLMQAFQFFIRWLALNPHCVHTGAPMRAP